MLIGVGDKILVMQNSRVPQGQSGILQLSYTNFGTNIWFIDCRRYFASYRIAQLANNTGINAFYTPHLPIDIGGVTSFFQPDTNNLPVFFNNIDGSNCVYIWHGVGFGRFVSTPNNLTNSATSLTAIYRIRLESINTTNNVGHVAEILNQTNNAHRIGILFTNYSGVLNLGIVVGNTDTANEYYRFVSTDLSFIYNKWVTIVADINYVTRVARIWLNGILLLTSTVTEITAGALPNTDYNANNVIGSSGTPWKGYCSYARVLKNATLTNDDVVLLCNNIENSSLSS